MFMVLEFSSSIRRDEYVFSPSAWSVQGIKFVHCTKFTELTTLLIYYPILDFKQVWSRSLIHVGLAPLIRRGTHYA